MRGRLRLFLTRSVRSFTEIAFDKIRGNNDSLVFQKLAEFFWTVPFIKSFSEVTLKKFSGFRSGFSIFLLWQIMKQFSGSCELFRPDFFA